MSRNPAFSKEYLIIHKESDDIKKKARSLVNSAIITGDIQKDSFCWWCLQNKRTAAHHEDYSKPLEVIWLCGRCHFYARYTWAGPNWTYFREKNRSVRPRNKGVDCKTV